MQLKQNKWIYTLAGDLGLKFYSYRFVSSPEHGPVLTSSLSYLDFHVGQTCLFECLR